MTNGSTTKAKGDDFPIVCETCLGPNPYVRMQKDVWGSSCKVCERPFTSFRWRPAGLGTRPKKTEVCQTCARAKNVCQTCILDLQYGLPVQVRDASMAAGDRQRTVVPQSDGTREYAAAQSERAIANGDIDAIYNAPKVNDIAEKAKRTAPKYERNRARVCSFFLKGTCTRGLYCPYRHEKPDEGADDSLTEQNLRDRYYGVNDPVAERILQKAGVSGNGVHQRGSRHGRKGSGPPPPPDDPTIQTLFIGGVAEVVTEKDLRKLFSGHNGLSRLSVLANKGIAFAEFDSRKNAEAALRSLHGQHEINGARVFVNWGRQSNRNARSQTTNNCPSPELPPAMKPRVEDPSKIPAQSEAPPPKRRRQEFGQTEREPKEAKEIENPSKLNKPTTVLLPLKVSKKSLMTFPAFDNPILKDKAALPPRRVHRPS